MLDWEMTERPSMEQLAFLTDRINEEAKDQEPATSFGFFVREKNGRIIAGASGSLIFGEVYTDQLWVDRAFRKKGLGRALMEKVHQYGKQKGCQFATVTTMSFQAVDFYKKLGYQVDFSKSGYHRGASCLYLSKMI